MTDIECERRKQKYIDKLKNASPRKLNNNLEVLDIRNDNSSCFNRSNPKYYEHNDLLDKIERYTKANPLIHITNNRLTRKRDLLKQNVQPEISTNRVTAKRDINKQNIQSEIQNKNNLSTNKYCDVHNLENVISFIKPKQKLVNYKPDSYIKFGPPKATSTIIHQQTQFISISSKYNDKPTDVSKSNNYGKDEKMHITGRSLSNRTSSSRRNEKSTYFSKSNSYGNSEDEKLYCSECSLSNRTSFSRHNGKPTYVSTSNSYGKDEKIYSSECSLSNRTSSCVNTSLGFNVSKNVESNTKIPSGQEINTKKRIRVDEKAKINLTNYFYLEFVNSYCDEIKSISEDFNLNKDYNINLKNKFHVLLKNRSKQAVNKINLNSSFGQVMNVNMPSMSPYSGSDFIFNPIINFSKSSDKCTLQFSQDSFGDSVQETLITNIENSTDNSHVISELNEDFFSSPEICLSENINKTIVTYKSSTNVSRSECITSFDSSPEQIIQISNIEGGSSSVESFKLYRKRQMY